MDAVATLLAKSPRDGEEKTLEGHIDDDLLAFETLFGERASPTRFAREWLRFFRLKAEDFDVFWVNGIAALGLHDLGKANDGFQDAVRHRGEQVLRHEHLSALLIQTPALKQWLETIEGVDVDLVTSAVLGHHLKASDQTLAAKHGERNRVPFGAAHPSVEAVFAALSKRLEVACSTPDMPKQWCYEGHGESIDQHADAIKKRFRRVKRDLGRDASRHRLFMAVKAALIVADSAGSGLARERHEIGDWLREVFAEAQCLDAEAIKSKVLRPRIEDIERARGPGFRYHGFQDEAAKQARRTLMIAPCGAGKTLAAWRWIAAQLDASPKTHVVFLYPTRATATEGFRDYVGHAPETDASLLTGTAAYELRDMFANPDDPRDGLDYLTDARLYALGYWPKRLFSATVDQFLSFMKQSYKGICLLPVMADAVVVVDEVHSFDVGLFDTFKKFLEHFDTPVLAMTASLPQGRQRELERLGLELFTGAGQEDLEASANQPRYGVERTDVGTAEIRVRVAVAAGERVLWVVNTVDRAQQLARSLADLDPTCYHSRFTLDDRKRRHNAVVEGFRGDANGGRLAITTQVCEMSLDLDAQMLVSEFAPISSLIQRMGRCNRVGRPEPGRVLLYEAQAVLPYDEDEIALAKDFVDEIAGATISQARLEELLARFTQGQGPEADRGQPFIDDGPWAQSRGESPRDAVDYTVQAILDGDLAAVRDALRRGAPVDGYIVPVPRRFGEREANLPAYLRLAPSSHYDPILGFVADPQQSDLAPAQGGAS
ncbi:MAG: CRISPR-associated helicase Cas3' [Gammaproteobacteria bacterium]